MQYDRPIHDFLVPDIVNDEFVCSSFDLLMDYLKTLTLFLWQKDKDHRVANDYSISTWSHYGQRTSTKKWGTDTDNALLPAPITWNKAHTITTT